MFNRNAELLRLVEATFDSKMASLRRIRKKILLILQKLQKKSSPFSKSGIPKWLLSDGWGRKIWEFWKNCRKKVQHFQKVAFQSDFSQTDEEEKLDNSEKIAENIFCFICLSFVDIWVVKYQLKVCGKL